MKKIVLVFSLILGTLAVNAQEQRDGYSTDLGRNSTFIKNGFWDNWFIGAGAGANIYFGDKDANADFGNRITVTPTFQVGKWFTPYLGARIKGTGGLKMHTFNQDATIMSRNRYVSAEANFLWNMSDYLLKYNSSRVYSFIPYVGFGWAYAWDYDKMPANIHPSNHVNSLTVDAGIINRFRFSDRFAVEIEFSAKALRDEFDQRTGGKRGYDLLGSASAGLVFNISQKPTFTEAVLRDQYEIDNLNNKINEQRSEIQRLNNLPIPEPTVVVKEVVKKEVVQKGNEPVNNVVLFRINQSKIDPYQEVNIYNVAKYLKDNPDMKVRIVGYTDTATGTAAINEKLSRQRAQNVADVITGKYMISKDRVIVDWKGQTAPPFDVVEWNRAVIMYLEEINQNNQ